jgi:ubiquinol-cytochrome c reductase cytochrome c1 subunit
MTKRLSLFALVLAAALPLAAFAAEGPETLEANTHLNDQASLQRGASLFMNYCSGCHSLKYMRYSRMGEDLGLSEDEVTKNLNFTGAKYGEQIKVAMNPDDANAWLGKTPPDLSMEGRLRGPDWIYTYLKSFYVDESRPLGWNNTLLANASMPNVLWQLQGIQHPVMGKGADGQPGVEKLVLAEKGSMDPEQYDQAARDISAFLQYVAEPAAMQRETWGVWVVLFLVVFTFLAYLLKHEYWRDVH